LNLNKKLKKKWIWGFISLQTTRLREMWNIESKSFQSVALYHMLTLRLLAVVWAHIPRVDYFFLPGMVFTADIE